MDLSHIENRINKLEQNRYFCLYYVNDVLNDILPTIENLCMEKKKETMKNTIIYTCCQNGESWEEIYEFDAEFPKYTVEEIVKIFFSLINESEFKKFDELTKEKVFKSFIDIIEISITYKNEYGTHPINGKYKIFDTTYIIKDINEYYDKEISKEKLKEKRTIKNYNKKLKSKYNI